VKALVVFDCDSTLASIEGIDELAERKGAGRRIAELTRAAMEGQTALEDVYGRRLEIIRPGREDLAWLGGRYRETLVAGAGEAVAALAAAGAEIHIVSGGLQPAVEILAADLGLAPARVHAVGVSFAADGRYRSFAAASPLARSGGKTAVVRGLVRPGIPAFMIGDGVTDLEAAAAGAVVIGFGGVVARPAVMTQADHFVAGPSLTAVADLILRLAGT
jgi:phosphoserine phosphatase